NDKRLYVWFDAVIGYLSASVEWARRTGSGDEWKEFWTGDCESFYFMGKDNVVFHAEIWPAMLFGYSGIGAKGGRPGELGALDRPYEVVSSEFLTMEGKKFSSSRNVVIYVGDMLSRYDADALRYYLTSAGPENQDTDFTWSEFVRRNNDELVAGWGNLVNRTISMTAKNLGSIPAPGELADVDRALLASSQAAFGTIGDLIGKNRQKAALGEVMKLVGEANKYLSDTAPWKLKNENPDRMASVLHTTLQVVDDVKTLITPFLPASSQRVHEALGGAGLWAAMPELVEVTEPTAVGSPSYSVLTGDYQTQAKWASTPIPVGRPLAAPTPVFTKLDTSVVEEELERLAAKAAEANPEA
ncbi:MAG: methionyl-tRNA synthetase, partial [Frankiales bacterium]|nr:methionyl-tRNA synthetase [Frankiales bacterium]